MSRADRRAPLHRRVRLPATAVSALLAAGLPLTACGSSGDGQDKAAGSVTVNVSLTKAGCVADPATVPAGPVTFKAKNTNASTGTEVELLNNSGRVLGEKENLTPGLSGSFSLRLEQGAYRFYCPGTDQAHTPFTVTGGTTGAATPAAHPSADAAVRAYHQYVVSEVAQLVTDTDAFAAAVTEGDLAKAKQLYAPSRYHYETIEPVAESFGDLDPDIDARENDVADPSTWTGFHRIEKALFQQSSPAGMGPYAAKLKQDVAKLQALVAEATYQPGQLANGAVELLDEIAKSKVTGEEERYSHSDLWDFAANLEGSRKAYDLVAPILAAKNPSLAATITSRFDALQAQLQGYRDGGGFVDYSTVPNAKRRQLTQSIDALAEPLSQVAALVS